MRRGFAGISLVALLPSAAWCQSAAGKPEFEIADVHVSPRSAWVKMPANSMQSGFLSAGRYEVRRATMLDLIKTAYGVDADKIYGGPSWLDYDRFEVIAKVPPNTRRQSATLMLQSLLADRFKLVVKMDTKAMPAAYVLTKAKGESKLTAADGSSSSGCQSRPPIVKDVPYGNIQCRGVTMDTFASALRRLASGNFNNLPVADSTGVEGAWDFDLQYPLRMVSANTGAVTNADGLFEAVEKQLGLKLELSKVPQPVLVVESVNEQPTANPPGVTTNLPPLPSPEFEVASVRPCQGGNMSLAPRFEPGGRVTAVCMALMTMIRRAWNLAPFEQPIGAPKWLESNSGNYDITAKAPPATLSDAQGNIQDQDALNSMMRALLVDRFKMAVHYEDRPMDAYALVAVKPKLTKTDPSNRTGCTRQNPPGGSQLSLRLVCQNITMAQFAEQLQGFNSDLFYPVPDATGLDGAWDFTLNYNILVNLPPVLAGRGGAAAPTEASEPSGAISFAEALEKQIGLKLEKQKRPEHVLVIDHIEEKPTEN